MSNSKRGIAVDENGKLDDEVSVISSDVRIFPSDTIGLFIRHELMNIGSKIENTTKGDSLVPRKLQVKAGMLSMVILGPTMRDKS